MRRFVRNSWLFFAKAGEAGTLKPVQTAARMVDLPSCKHCGAPVPSGRDDGFCCAGCAYVAELLHAQGLDHFYDLKGGKSLPPVSPQALRERDYEWLEQLASLEAGRTGEGRPVELRLALQGVSCVGCVWLIEKLFARQPGGLRVFIDVVHGTLTLVVEVGTFDAAGFARELQRFGYLVGPPRGDDDAGERRQASGLERRMGLCGAFAMNAMAFSLPAYFDMPADFAFASWFDLIAAASATLAMLVGGSYFIDKAWRSLQGGALHIDTPIALGIVAAYAGSVGGWLAGVGGLKYFDFVAIFIFLMLAGRWAQQAAVERNRRKLMRDTSIPERVTLLEDGKARPLSALQPGLRYAVKPGQSVPVASKLLHAAGSVSLEWINGESEAQPREPGQLLPSGALNIGLAPLEVEALEAWSESTLRRLLEARKPGEFRDRGLERLLRWYLGLVIAIGLTGALVWGGRGAGVARALEVMISIFVVSCPCALGVAVPLAEELAAARAERRGVFVRTLALWKRLMRVRRVVFDKTGTLTLENPVLEHPSALAALDDEARSALRTLVTGNLHPVSRSLFDALGPADGAVRVGAVEEVVGQGLVCTDDAGRRWSLGRSPEADARLACDGVVLADFRFRDELRGESVEEVAGLRRRGLQVHILSGDRKTKVAGIAAQLGLEPADWQARLTPEAKAAWVAEHDRGDTLYIGDGANDSLAFDAALCAGSPVGGRSFLEQKADFYFLGHSLRFVSGLLDLARVHRRATQRVFAFSVTYNVATVIVGLMGHLSPLTAAVLMPLSSVVTLSLVAWTFGRKAKA